MILVQHNYIFFLKKNFLIEWSAKIILFIYNAYALCLVYHQYDFSSDILIADIFSVSFKFFNIMNWLFWNFYYLNLHLDISTWKYQHSNNENNFKDHNIFFNIYVLCLFVEYLITFSVTYRWYWEESIKLIRLISHCQHLYYHTITHYQSFLA